MRITQPNRVVRTYVQKLVAEPARVFPLLCPVREAEWIENWDPEIVLSESGFAEPDCVFVTSGVSSDAIWYITQHDPDKGLVEMIKITPAVTACKLTIRLAPSETGSEATVTYAHTSLGTRGDAFVEAFTEEYYQSFMQEWEAQMNHFLSEGEALRAGAH